MLKKISAVKARHNLGEIMNEVALRNDQYIIERAGKPLAAMIPVWQLEHLIKQREAFFEKVEEIQGHFKDIPPEQIHHDQAPVEIYNMCSTEDALLEMEIHGPYISLQPGEVMRLSETWELFRYSGQDIPDAHINFIKEIIK